MIILAVAQYFGYKTIYNNDTTFSHGGQPMNDPLISLPDTITGQEYIIRSIDLGGKNNGVFADMVSFRRALIRHLFDSPAKDPSAYEVMGAVLALRHEDSEKILVSPATGA